jgi:hypothetical protein
MAPFGLFPAELEPWRRQDDGRVRMDVADVLDQRPSALRVTARPHVVDKDIGTLGQVTRPSGEDRATIARRPPAFDHVVAEASKGISFLTAEVEVMMDDEDASHVNTSGDAPRPIQVDR